MDTSSLRKSAIRSSKRASAWKPGVTRSRVRQAPMNRSVPYPHGEAPHEVLDVQDIVDPVVAAEVVEERAPELPVLGPLHQLPAHHAPAQESTQCKPLKDSGRPEPYLRASTTPAGRLAGSPGEAREDSSQPGAAGPSPEADSASGLHLPKGETSASRARPHERGEAKLPGRP